MSRFSPNSIVLSMLPILAVFGVLSLGTPHQNAAAMGAGTLVLYLPPSSATDPVHVVELGRLLQTIKTYDDRAATAGVPRPSHAGLAAEYRLIVQETTSESIRRAGLPLDVR